MESECDGKRKRELSQQAIFGICSVGKMAFHNRRSRHHERSYPSLKIHHDIITSITRHRAIGALRSLAGRTTKIWATRRHGDPKALSIASGEEDAVVTDQEERRRTEG